MTSFENSIVKQISTVVGVLLGFVFAYKYSSAYRGALPILVRYLTVAMLTYIAWAIIKEDIYTKVPEYFLHIGLLVGFFITYRFSKVVSGANLLFVALATSIMLFAYHFDPAEFAKDLYFVDEDTVSKFVVGLGFLIVFLILMIRLSLSHKKSRQKDRMQIEALTRSTSLDQILSEVAHEISQPITSIKIDSEMASDILKSSKCSSEVDEIVDDVVVKTDHCIDVIANIKNFVSKEEIKKEQVEVNKSISKMFKLLSHELKQYNIATEQNLDESKSTVYMSLIELEQVLLNLCKNAISAMASNTRSKNKLTIVSQSSGNQVQIIVEDTGCEVQNKEELFSLFKSTKQHSYDEGLGLGLSLSRKIIRSYEGTLKLLSSSEKGTKFIIELPKYAEE
jgi:signal transduction histidine kinase